MNAGKRTENQSDPSHSDSQKRFVEQATAAREETTEDADAERTRHQTEPMPNPAAYDEAGAGRELDGGESLLSGKPREGSNHPAEDTDVPARGDSKS